MGRVKRLKYTSSNHKKRPVGELKPYRRGRYELLCLWKDSMSKTFYLHRIVAEHFLDSLPHCPTCETPYEINHRDTNRHNNAASNLEYVTHQQNMEHAQPHARARMREKIAILTTEKVGEIKRLLSDGILSQRQIATQFGVGNSAICNISKGRHWKEVLPTI